MKATFNILLVSQDETLSQEILGELSPHFNVVLARGEKEAADILRSSYDYQWHVILVDQGLQALDGIGFIIYLRIMLNTRNIPVILMMDKLDAAYLEDTYEAGAFDFLAKPIQHLELLTRIRLAVRMGQHLSEITEMATKDSLTSLYNRRTFFNFFNKSFYSARRYNKRFSLALFDLDSFKEINDHHGHIAGDIVLTAVGKVFQSNLRTADVAGRIGGEEFAVLLEETDEEEGFKAIERIRREVCELHFDFLEGEKISISAGIVLFNPEIHQNVGDVFRDADTALYYSKNSGRNRSTPFSRINITH